MLEPRIYRRRFDDRELARAPQVWRPICRFLQRYVPEGGTALDLGAGYCHFINHIRAARRIAVDINEETISRYAAPGVERLVSDGADPGLEPGSIDAVFASNVYEHFPSREQVAASFDRVYELLRPGGAFIILQPNFRFSYRRYFDFFDHRLAFTHLGMREGLEMSGFALERVEPRFLPYSTKSAYPQREWLVRLYLRLPIVWRLLGRQMLLVARKPAALDGAG